MKKLTQTVWYPEPRGPTESSSSRARAKVERPQDVPEKIKPLEHVYGLRKKGYQENGTHTRKKNESHETHLP